jgi:hypothetical protein
MRPLNKGNTPVDSLGNPIAATDYKNWRKNLIERIGYYCVYCNQPLSHSLQVEHVIPKNPPAGFAGDPLAWDNMLLACGPCNNAKSNNPIDASTYYLPEEHNTHLPFLIEPSVLADHAIVTEKAGLTAPQSAKAKRTIKLLELNNVDERDNIVDIRSIRRRDAIVAVQANRQQFEEARHSPTFQMNIAARNVVVQAKVTGFFSIWYEVFADVPEVMQFLTDNNIIKGTAGNCFDPANGYQPIFRNPANVIDPI